MHLELCRGYKKDPLPTYVAEVAQSWRVAGDNWDWWPHTIETIVRCCMHNSPSLSLSLSLSSVPPREQRTGAGVLPSCDRPLCV
jgi:hypothetical protein